MCSSVKWECIINLPLKTVVRLMPSELLGDFGWKQCLVGLFVLTFLDFIVFIKDPPDLGIMGVMGVLERPLKKEAQ